MKSKSQIFVFALALSLGLATDCTAATPRGADQEADQESPLPFAVEAGEPAGEWAEAKYASYGKEYGYFVPDFVMFDNWHKNPNFYEAINGEMKFKDGARPRLLVLLPPVDGFSDYYLHSRDLSPSTLSYRDYEVNNRINKILVAEAFKYRTFFGKPIKSKDVKYLRLKRNDFGLAFRAKAKRKGMGKFQPYPYLEQNCPSFARDIEGYDVIVAPRVCILDAERIKSDRKLTSYPYFAEKRWFSRKKLYKQAVQELQKEAEDYRRALAKRPDTLSLLEIKNFRAPNKDRLKDGSRNSGRFCSLAGVDQLSLDAVSIMAFKRIYSADRFDDLNRLFIDLTQEKKHSCRYIVLSLSQKEKLKTALDRKNVAYGLPNQYYRLSNPLKVIQDYYEELNIKSREEYRFYRDIGFDKKAIAAFQSEGITTYDRYDEFKRQVASQIPSADLGTVKGALHAISVKKKADAKNMTIAAYLKAEKEEKAALVERRRAEEKERVKRNRAAEKEKAKEFPYYALVSCGTSGVSVDVRACFKDTTLILAMNDRSVEKKSWQLGEVGSMRGDVLVVDLRRKFLIRAQNSSETLGITIEIKDRVTGRTIASDQANSLYSVARVRR